jgi:hypothetical protein
MINRNNELRILTESQIETLKNGLGVAAEIFEKNVLELTVDPLRTMPDTTDFLIDQFRIQTRDTRELLTLIGSCEQITIETSQSDPKWCYSCDRSKDDCACEPLCICGHEIEHHSGDPEGSSPCESEECECDEYRPVSASTSGLDWTKLGKLARQSALDAHNGELPSVEIAYSFMLCNPECFLAEDELDWPQEMPSDPPADFIAAYNASAEVSHD